MATHRSNVRTPRVCSVGEVMLELAPLPPAGTFRLGFGGDTCNTAIYLARQGIEVEYFSALGDDRFSTAILDALRREGVCCDNVKRCANRSPGLYLVSNDPSGERSFHYWRDSSPVRALFDSPQRLPACTVLYFSGITLAVVQSGLQQFLTQLDALRSQGVTIVMDCNYRQGLWSCAATARDAYRQVLARCDLLFSGVDDEQALWGQRDIEGALERYHSLGITEVLIRDHALAAHVSAGDERFTLAAQRREPVDTTGAGDAFNAACLASRLQHDDWRQSVLAGHQLAARVVQTRGAIIEPIDIL